VLIVAGISLKNLQPRVWDPRSLYYVPNLRAVMVSYADFAKRQTQRRKAMDLGLRDFLGIPPHIQIYLDNGAFYFLAREGETPRAEYEEFVARSQPDWWPIPQDFIPTPRMTRNSQQACFERTMDVNLAYQHDGYVPIIHISEFLVSYIAAIQTNDRLSAKPCIALGGIVPNLLRAPKAIPYEHVVQSMKKVRELFAAKRIHVFGVGGTATLHLAALFGMDSVDSSGWRNRAARGIIQLPGGGDRSIAELGNWRGRHPSPDEWERLSECSCPACSQYGLDGLRERAMQGFCNRATHNLWTILQEARLIERHLANGTYAEWYGQHLDNSIYRPLIDRALELTAHI
jgi:7-cyano-7-deazaguanine tRNA-ribosyltransferase